MGGGVSGAGFAGPLPVQGKVSLDASIATSKSMSQNKSIARAIGYSRTKKYALVVDHPYVQLSDDFIDAIDDARSENNYQALIDRFGTHCPYAVTYGAAAKVTQSFDENGYKTKAREERGVSGALEGADPIEYL